MWTQRRVRGPSQCSMPQSQLQALTTSSQSIIDPLLMPSGAAFAERLTWWPLQLELDSAAEADCMLDAARSEADHEAEQRIIRAVQLTPEQVVAVKQVLRLRVCQTVLFASIHDVP